MQLSINNHLLPNEMFLGDEFCVEITAVDPTKETWALISNFTAPLVISAVCKETGQQLVLTPSRSQAWAVGGICELKLSLDETSFVNNNSIGKSMEIVVTFEGYGRVEVSKTVEIVRARLYLDCPCEVPDVFFKDAKTSNIPVTLSLRDRYGGLVEEDCELKMTPLYEDLGAPNGISPVADCSILRVVGDGGALLRRGRGRVHVRLETFSGHKTHKKRRFIIQTSALNRSLGIASVWTTPISAKAKDHKLKNGKKLSQSGRPPVKPHPMAPKKEPKVEKKEPLTPRMKMIDMSVLRFQIAQAAIGEYLVKKLASLRWVESTTIDGSPFYEGVTNPNNEINALKARLKGFLGGDMFAFDDCMISLPSPHEENWGHCSSQETVYSHEAKVFDFDWFLNPEHPTVKKEPIVKKESEMSIPQLTRIDSSDFSIEGSQYDFLSFPTFDEYDACDFDEEEFKMIDCKKRIFLPDQDEDECHYSKLVRTSSTQMY